MTPAGSAVEGRSDDGLRLLLVDSDVGRGQRLRSALEASERMRFELVPRADLAAALDDLRESAADLLLLGLPRDGEPGLAPFVELHSRVPDLPVLVLCASQHEPLGSKAVQLGAADYLVTDELYPILVERSVRHALEVAAVRRLLERRQREDLSDLVPEPEAVAVAPAASLQEALPGRFADLAEEYERLLDAAVESLAYRVDRPVADGLRRLAAAAGELRAGPRDLIELHTRVLTGKKSHHGPQRMKLYQAEGHLRLLELMGYLVSYYRQAWIAARRGEVGS